MANARGSLRDVVTPWVGPAVLVVLAFVLLCVDAVPRMHDGVEDLRHLKQAMSDEHQIMTGVLSMVDRGDLDHGVRVYPGIYPYGVAAIRLVVGADVSQVFVAVRWASLITMMVGLLAGFLLLGRAAEAPWAAAVFTAAVAVHPETVVWASRIHPDALLISLDHAALAVFVLAVDRRSDRLLVGATVLAALSASTKLVGCFIMTVIGLYIVWNGRSAPRMAVQRLLKHSLLFGAIVLATNPQLFIDPARTVEGFVVQHQRNRRGLGGIGGWWSVLTGPNGLGWAGSSIAVIGVLGTLWRRRMDGLAWMTFFAVGYGAFVVLGVRLNLPRYAFPAILPLLFVGLAALGRLAVQRNSQRATWLALAVLLAMGMLHDRPDQRRVIEDYATFYRRSFDGDKQAVGRALSKIERKGRVVTSPYAYVPEPLDWKFVWTFDEIAFPDDAAAIVIDDKLRQGGGQNLKMLEQAGFVATATIGEYVIYERR